MREGGKEESAILMMSFSPWEEEEETYAASRGAGAGLTMHMLAAFFLHTEIRLTAAVYPHFGLSMSLLLFALFYITVDL